MLLCADALIRDAESNNMSAITIYEELTPIGLPLFLPRLSILSVYEREEGDLAEVIYDLRVKLDEEILLTQQIPVNFQGKFRFRNLMVLAGLPVAHPGKLIIQISNGEDTMGEYSITINQPVAPRVVSTTT